MTMSGFCGIHDREGLVLLPEVADGVGRNEAVAALDRRVGPAVVADVRLLGHSRIRADRGCRRRPRRHDDERDQDGPAETRGERSHPISFPSRCSGGLT